MKKRPSDILSQVERDLLVDRSVAGVLRKLILLGGQAGSSELREWASRELRGYEVGQTLPSYRFLPAPIQIDGITSHAMIKHQTISLLEFPDFVREDIQERVPVRFGVGEIESLIHAHRSDRTVQIQVPGATVLAEMIDHSNPHQRTTAVYWALNVSALEGLIDQIKTRLAELTSELRSMTSPVGDVLTAPQATNAVNLVINGKNSKVNIAQASDGGTIVANPPTLQVPARKFWTIGKGMAGIAVGGATIGGFLLAWWQFQAGG